MPKQGHLFFITGTLITLGLATFLINYLTLSGNRERTVIMIAFKKESIEHAIEKLITTDTKLISGSKYFLVIKISGHDLQKISTGNIYYFPSYNIIFGCSG